MRSRWSPSDALGILNGNDDAATQYLRQTSEDELRRRYRPIVADHLERVDGVTLYTDIARSWNRLPGVKPLEADLESFVTDKAMDGLFFVIAREEQRIRRDPVAHHRAVGGCVRRSLSVVQRSIVLGPDSAMTPLVTS